MLAEFIHTGVLKMYHGLMVKTDCHKLQHYSYHGMGARTQVAILDHKHNVRRAQAKTTDDAANTNLSHKMADVQFRRMGKNCPGFWCFR